MGGAAGRQGPPQEAYGWLVKNFKNWTEEHEPYCGAVKASEEKYEQDYNIFSVTL